MKIIAYCIGWVFCWIVLTELLDATFPVYAEDPDGNPLGALSALISIIIIWLISRAVKMRNYDDIEKFRKEVLFAKQTFYDEKSDAIEKVRAINWFETKLAGIESKPNNTESELLKRELLKSNLINLKNDLEKYREGNR